MKKVKNSLLSIKRDTPASVPSKTAHIIPLKRHSDTAVEGNTVRKPNSPASSVVDEVLTSDEEDAVGEEYEEEEEVYEEKEEKGDDDFKVEAGETIGVKGRGRGPIVTTRRRSKLVLGQRSSNFSSVALSRLINPSSVKNVLAKPFKVPTFLSGDRPAAAGGMLRAGTTLGITRRVKTIQAPLFDPGAESAIILYEPPEIQPLSATEALEALKSTFDPTKKVPDRFVHVVVDPILGKVLRPHQIEGVQFMYDCVTGNKKEGCFGCIMADEMGLGKTLQCITLMWTLLKQSPVAGKPTIDKVIIACPSSLVKNWGDEIRKWLGGRVNYFACDNKGTKAQTVSEMERYTNAKGRSITQPVLIISYESLRGYTEIIKKTEVGLLLCDEGHRLKNSNNQTYQALNSLNAKRRVILSGTPIQNDLTEYFSLLTFTIPNVLGTNSEFRKNFENPILRGRDSLASDKEKEISELKLNELLATANQFIIRRTAALLSKYLPVKYEYVVFCKFSPLQRQVYENFTKSKQVKKLLNGDGTIQPLRAITLLKKLCNHPALLVNVEGNNNSYSSSTRGSSSNKPLHGAHQVKSDDFDVNMFPPEFDFGGCQTEFSGKMQLLDKMLTKMRKETSDKIVLISNYTQTLDMFEKLCRNKRWGNVRLDGTLTIQKRGLVVKRFNDPESPEFIMLLSSKAGGCGLNLIGANRLILFDPDWNPANDGQALARVWRDGQKKVCFIYRFIATGSIEEKIFQRQAHKQSLSACVVDEEENVERHFSADNLRQLFQYNAETTCETHDTFQCKRCVKGKQIKGPPQSEAGVNTGVATDTSTWNHYSEQEQFKVFDDILKQCSKDTQKVSFVFQNKSHEPLMIKTMKIKDLEKEQGEE